MITTLLFLLALPAIFTIIALIVTKFKTSMTERKRKWWRIQILIAYDQLVNACFQGWADETISSRSYRRCLQGRRAGLKLIDGIFFWEKDHCMRSYYSERERLQLPPELRGEEHA